MTHIALRRHKFNFYISLIFGSLFFLGMGITLIVMFINKHLNTYIELKDYFKVVFGIPMVFMSFFTIYQYFKNVPKIIVDENLISFNAKTFSPSDIENVAFKGKCKFHFIIPFPMEAATILFRDGSIQTIFDEMYENSWELKSYLKQVIIEKQNFWNTEIIPVTKADLRNDFFDVFKNNFFLSFKGIILLSMIGFFLFLMIANENSIFVITFFIFTLWAVFLFARIVYYFKVSGKYFVIKNHLYFWKWEAFRLTDIDEIVLESGLQGPNCLRVITRDFKYKIFAASTLHDKTWLNLKDKLESYKVKVRNESILETRY
jgi:hypothetical protein